MDLLQFVASIVDSLAWPSAFALILFFFRSPLVNLLPRVRSLKYRDLHVDFEEALSKIEQQIETGKRRPELAPDEHRDERLSRAVDFSPNFAVFEAWLNVEDALKRLARESGVSFRRGSSPLYLARMLRSHGIIDAQTAALLDDLRALRNLAIHPDPERPISVEEARRYGELANEVSALLEQSRHAQPSA
jgi:uncharacterized protein YutE (UPF0331/DUF86 family)